MWRFAPLFTLGKHQKNRGLLLPDAFGMIVTVLPHWGMSYGGKNA